MGELCFGGRWAPKLTKGPYNPSNWVEGYAIVMDKYTFKNIYKIFYKIKLNNFFFKNTKLNKSSFQKY